MSLQKTTAEFDSIVDSNPYVKKSFEEQTIIGSKYLFSPICTAVGSSFEFDRRLIYISSTKQSVSECARWYCTTIRKVPDDSMLLGLFDRLFARLFDHVNGILLLV